MVRATTALDPLAFAFVHGPRGRQPASVSFIEAASTLLTETA
jgi:hypothetical protein